MPPRPFSRRPCGSHKHARWRFGFDGSLVVASAMTAGCRTLLSEDLQYGQRLDGLTVVDPFR